MDLFKNRFLFYPVIFLFVLFLLDKIFLLPEVRDNFIQPGGMLYYRQRDLQVARLKEYLAEEKREGERVAVVFGDSRSFALGDSMAALSGKKGWKIFNFAAPQGLPAYEDYLAARIFDGLHRPSYLIVGLSPDVFNRNSGLFFTPNLNWGVDYKFIEKNRPWIPDRDFDAYKDSRRFALPGLPFSLKTLYNRLNHTLKGGKGKGGISVSAAQLTAMLNRGGETGDPAVTAALLNALQASKEDLSLYSLENSPQRKVLDSTGGAQYAWIGYMTDAQLKEETRRLEKLYLAGFRISEEQFFFFERMIRRARRSGARVIVFWPVANPYMAKLYDKIPALKEMRERVRRSVEMVGGELVDLNRVSQVSCTQFYDASHLSVSCFPAINRYLLGRLERP